MNKNPMNLKYKEPDKLHCNARTKYGYCRQRPGARTGHPGEGRCYLHGGSSLINKRTKPDDLANFLYSKYLPTTLQLEMAEIKNDPLFSTMYSEYALLRTIIQSLLRSLPADLSIIYGKPVCAECKKKLETTSGKKYMFKPYNAASMRTRLEKVVSTIDSMGRIFERISKHEERQKRFVTITELESIVAQWAKILLDVFGEDPRIELVKSKIMQQGFIRYPGQQDAERLEAVEKIRSIKGHSNKTKSLAKLLKEIAPETISDVAEVEDL